MPVDGRVREFIRLALEEDIGRGDVTTALTVDPSRVAVAELVAKQAFVLAGLPVAREVFRAVDQELDMEARMTDGARLRKGQVIASITGRAAAILTAERVALNILQRLSGVATLTSKYAEALNGEKARVLDTRKTTPGMRQLEKYAVMVGGGKNHRFGLDDGILIKDNHIEAAGGITRAVELARRGRQPFLKIEVECSTESEVREALEAGAEIIMLDNMKPELMRKCVRLVSGRAMVEASGNITLRNIKQVAATGVDYISVGALTHSAPAVDISLRMR
jgi:nicotinate-nucleotide pyrophosphorylase (carboxylating)